jgi:hypothetical protein
MGRVDFKVIFRVLELEISLFNKCGDLFKLVVGILRMVQEDAVEDFSEMAIKVFGNVAADLFALA